MIKVKLLSHLYLLLQVSSMGMLSSGVNKQLSNNTKQIRVINKLILICY